MADPVAQSVTDARPRGAEIDLSILVKAFNEAASLETVVTELGQAFATTPWIYEIIVVNDGSNDGTGDIADALARRDERIRVIHHPENRGIGEVYRTGLGAMGGTFMTWVDGDGQFPAEVFPRFLQVLQTQPCDLVLGYVDDPQETRSPFGKVLSFGERSLYRLMFGRLPKFQGALMFRATMYRSLGLRPAGRGWGMVMELIIRATRGGYRVINLPITLRARMSGSSKVTNFATIWANLRQAFEVWRRLRARPA
jgi:glycosyltransferase involved in cell wall biosynthesis